jgi:hypothetical protein
MFTSFSTLWDPIPADLRKTRRQAFRTSCPAQSFQWLPEILLTDRRFGFICYRNADFNERTGTPFNRLHYPTDVISLVVLWCFRYKLSLREPAELLLQRGVVFTHEAVRDWDTNLTPYLTEPDLPS